MYMSLVKDRTVQDDLIAQLVWVARPAPGALHPAGDMASPHDLPDAYLAFVLSTMPQTGADVLRCEPCIMPDGPAILRLDEVCFPLGAVAHRHTHNGAGLRHLVRGSLRLEADNHTDIMTAGDSWYEPANAPVRAVSLHDQGVTSFVRAMVIPAAFAGKSTFRLMDPAEADLPRLQVTHRHIDMPLQCEAG